VIVALLVSVILTLEVNLKSLIDSKINFIDVLAIRVT
jgi:hypothetical protein